MILLSQELPLSISLNQDTYRNAAQFARAGFEAAECCLPTRYHAEVDLSIFPAYLEEVCPRIADGGLRIASFHLPFGTYWDISSPDETIRAGAVQALAQLIRLLAPYPGNNLVLHPSFEPIEECAREAHIAACQKSLRELAPIAEETGKKSPWKICRAPAWAAPRRKWSASRKAARFAAFAWIPPTCSTKRRRTFCGAAENG